MHVYSRECTMNDDCQQGPGSLVLVRKRVPEYFKKLSISFLHDTMQRLM